MDIVDVRVSPCSMMVMLSPCKRATVGSIPDHGLQTSATVFGEVIADKG
jgi:hypothetical protein